MAEFGTSGLRGLATDLTDALCATYAAAFASLHGHNGRIFVGQDRRESSPRIARAVAAGLAGQGLRVVDCGVLPTPALAAAALAEGTLSIMVTGSHIPADRNGLKFYTGTGEFTKDDEDPLRQAVAGWGAPKLSDTPPEQMDAAGAYVARYVDGFPKGVLKGKRIGVWLHSSAAYQVLPAILDGLGAEVVALGASDTFVSVDTEAVDGPTRQELAGWVAEHGLDALVSTDGDADRPLMVDDTGTVVPGDILGPVTARWLGVDEVVTTVSANTMVDLMGCFAQIARTRIGSPYVIAEMEGRMAAGAAHVAGYEPNGGFLLGWDVSRSGPSFATYDARLGFAPCRAAGQRFRGGGRVVGTGCGPAVAPDRHRPAQEHPPREVPCHCRCDPCGRHLGPAGRDGRPGLDGHDRRGKDDLRHRPDPDDPPLGERPRIALLCRG